LIASVRETFAQLKLPNCWQNDRLYQREDAIGYKNHVRTVLSMGFAAYLDYRGVPVEGVGDEAAGPNSVVLAAKAVAEDGPCVEWVRIRCLAVSEPASGDLVIVLPDDKASLAETSVYRERGEKELLLSYEPYPSIPHWLHSLFDSLHVATTIYTPKTNPARWMDGSVTIWR
jgi:hypothetical protein